MEAVEIPSRLALHPSGSNIVTGIHSSEWDASGSALPEERLINTKTLTLVHCHYNTRYGLIICDLCEAAIPLRLVPKHASSLSRNVTFMDSKGKLQDMPISHGFSVGNHAIFISRLRQEIKDEIIKIDESIVNIPIRDDNGDGRWTERPLPLSGQKGPILGLRVFEDAYCCNTCHVQPVGQDTPSNDLPYASPSRDTVY